MLRVFAYQVTEIRALGEGDQFWLGEGDQFWLCIVHNAKFSGCDGHCCCHLISSTQNMFVV